MCLRINGICTQWVNKKATKLCVTWARSHHRTSDTFPAINAVTPERRQLGDIGWKFGAPDVVGLVFRATNDVVAVWAGKKTHFVTQHKVSANIRFYREANSRIFPKLHEAIEGFHRKHSSSALVPMHARETLYNRVKSGITFIPSHTRRMSRTKTKVRHSWRVKIGI